MLDIVYTKNIETLLKLAHANPPVMKGILETVNDPRRKRIDSRCAVEAYALGLTTTVMEKETNPWIAARETFTNFRPEVREYLAKMLRPSNVIELPPRYQSYR